MKMLQRCKDQQKYSYDGCHGWMGGWVPLSRVKSKSEEMSLVVVEAVELWKTRRGFSKPCGKAAEGRLSIGR